MERLYGETWGKARGLARVWIQGKTLGLGEMYPRGMHRPGKILNLASSHLTYLLLGSCAQGLVRERGTERGNPRKQKSPGHSGELCSARKVFVHAATRLLSS